MGYIILFLVIFFIVLMIIGLVVKGKESKAQSKLLQNKEYECKCNACNHVWCYGIDEIKAEKKAKTFKAAKSLSYLGGNKIAMAYGEPQGYDNFDKCPHCGSKRIEKKLVNL